MTWQGLGPSTQAATLACPRCGSTDARTLRVIHEGGTSTSRGTATGWQQGYGSQPGHVTTYSVSSTRQTAAAKAAAPPRKRHNGVALIGLGIAVPILAVAFYYLVSTSSPASAAAYFPAPVVGVIVGVALLVAGIVVAPRDSHYNSQVFPAALSRWEHTWACQRCGNRFVA